MQASHRQRSEDGAVGHAVFCHDFCRFCFRQRMEAQCHHPRLDRRQHQALICGNEDEKPVRRRFLQQFQESISRGLIQFVRPFDEADLVMGKGGRKGGLGGDVLDLIDADLITASHGFHIQEIKVAGLAVHLVIQAFFFPGFLFLLQGLHGKIEAAAARAAAVICQRVTQTEKTPGKLQGQRPFADALGSVEKQGRGLSFSLQHGTQKGLVFLMSEYPVPHGDFPSINNN